MENKLDNLFRDQLSKHEKSPSDQAWGQIHDLLAAKRKTLWIRRLSIAASILFIATIGFVGYQSLDDITKTNPDELANSTQSNDEVESNSEIRPNEGLAISNEQEADEAVESVEEKQDNEKMVDLQAAELAEVPAQVEQESSAPIKDNADITVKPVEPLLAEAVLDEAKPETDLYVEAEKPSIDHELINHDKNEVSSTETIVEGDQVAEQIAEQEMKTYPKLRIVYKANQDSELVDSGKQTKINKGINKGIDKITEFSDEHLLTTERKTRLRNTKEDLLALNFGKLLNKSNKDLEN